MAKKKPDKFVSDEDESKSILEFVSSLPTGSHAEAEIVGIATGEDYLPPPEPPEIDEFDIGGEG